ncbi:Low molecular weight protein tyrosine phosphatase [bacterium endosymbiont of Bathymodiolus sp. 5 South]|nr:Low molecular weight protein tyrosine phosphatase (EC 3.1.3.48) [uncultured Gammaproteobacteria bacterium]SHN92397.1 Low molecular weight protein tyrosine phosphatase [bacterium endosymbiont of Bathymodiolus sp. 5 South]SSC08555.1 Low molecular weight protein tyrosine phosphatase [bacterium endosymbiont of Bathymodiolus sp. 5 South]VVH60222.1 Low molecular weight protein tyrosine phosphatase (EC [uncultured Gammaproteobacteria bacterium]VVH63634.1 Low molecular weight protein tyrosine phosph
MGKNWILLIIPIYAKVSLCNNLTIKKGVITPFSLVKSH